MTGPQNCNASKEELQNLLNYEDPQIEVTKIKENNNWDNCTFKFPLFLL